MPLLYYWRGDNYRRDLDMGAGYHLNQANPRMHQIDFGDSLWAFTRTLDGRYVLAAELVVRAKTLNPPNFRYGRYRVWGDLRKSRYFMVERQPSVEQIIRSLSCRVDAPVLGQAFQGNAAVRPINLEDHRILTVAAQGLQPEPRARLLPEEKLEAALLLGEKEVDVDKLKEELLELRARLDKSFSPDTALNALQNDVPSAGHCAAAAAIVWGALAGSLVSASVNGISHWFNRIQIDDQLLDLDITGDQFGYSAIQIKPAEKLYPYTRERSPDELNGETLRRAALLARRAGLLRVTESLEKRRQGGQPTHSA